MSIRVKAKCTDCAFKNGEFRIFKWSPVSKAGEIRLSNNFDFSTKGEDPYISTDKEYEIEIEEISYSQKYGGTYHIISVPSLMSLDLQNLTDKQKFEILMDCTSSERIANSILGAYPDFITRVMTEGKEAIDIKLIKGVGDVYLSSYIRTLNEKYRYYSILQHFNDYNLNITDCKALIEAYKDETTISKEIQANPYKVLVSVLKRSFTISDRLIIELRPEFKKTKIRCEYLILDVLTKTEYNGSSRLGGNDLYYYIENNYSQAKDLQDLVVDVVKNSDLFYYDEREKDLSIMSTYLGELKISNFIKEKLSKNHEWDFEWERFKQIKDGVLTDEQSNVLKMICEKDFVILNAPAGCGKSSAMMAVLDMLDYYNIMYRCMVAIGRGAKRLSEQTNRPASTIHKACLGDGIISEDVLIVDEHSMLSLELTLMIINTIVNPNIKILFIGDVDQLPSIGVGRIVKDMIESGKVPTCTLTKCFRFGEGGMSMVSALVREGKFYLDYSQEDNNEILLGKKNDYKFVNFKANDNVDKIILEYKKLIDNGIKPQEICLLSPHNINDFGTIELNNHIQTLINPPLPKEKNMKLDITKSRKTYHICFRVGDMVMNTKNNYSVLTEEGLNIINDSGGFVSKEDVKNVEVFNGEVGKILAITKDGLKILFDENIVIFSKKEAYNLLLAYSSNPYKMQGSQNKWIIVLTISAHQNSLNKQLLYTALTRASEGVVEIGQISVMRDAVGIVGDDRDTRLKDMLLDDEGYYI